MNARGLGGGSEECKWLRPVASARDFDAGSLQEGRGRAIGEAAGLAAWLCSPMQ